MIGNDIVDLEFARHKSRWQEQRFLNKLFSQEEQHFILSNGMRFQNIWRLWSMKESAYKIISRVDGRVRFNPKSYECFVCNETEGRVSFENTSISTLTSINQNFIQTTAFFDTNWISEVFRLNAPDVILQHKATYQHAIKRFADMKGVSKDRIKILKNAIGAPQFYMNSCLQEEALSLTHHGNFGAVVIAY